MNAIDSLIAKWQRSKDSHASHLLGGMINSMEDYKHVHGMYYIHAEILEDLKKLRDGVEDDDADGVDG